MLVVAPDALVTVVVDAVVTLDVGVSAPETDDGASGSRVEDCAADGADDGTAVLPQPTSTTLASATATIFTTRP